MSAYTCDDCGRTWPSIAAMMLCPCNTNNDVKTGKTR